jgi:hypothetical protein
VQNQQVGKNGPTLSRYDSHKILLDLDRIRILGQAQPPGYPTHVRVHDNPFLQAEGVSQHDIGCFSSHPGEPRQGLHGFRDFPVMFLYQNPTTGLDGSCFVPKKSSRSDPVLEVFQAGIGKVARFRVAAEQPGRHLVHTFVGALSRQDGRYEKFEWVRMP